MEIKIKSYLVSNSVKESIIIANIIVTISLVILVVQLIISSNTLVPLYFVLKIVVIYLDWNVKKMK